MATHIKNIDVIDSFTAGWSKTTNNYRDPQPIWRSENSADFFIPLAQDKKLCISDMTEPGHYGGGPVNVAVFELDDRFIQNKKILKVDLNFYISKTFNYQIEALLDGIGSIYPKVGWNVITGRQLRNGMFGIKSYDQTKEKTWLEIYSTREGSNKPYATVTYEDVPPKVGTITPDNINIDTRKELKVSWTMTSTDNKDLTGSIIRYSNGGTSWKEVEYKDKTTSHVIPANYFNKDSFALIQVRVKDGNNIWSEYRETKLETNVVKQKAPILSYPLAGYLSGSEEITFIWRFRGGWDYEEQSRYDIEISTDRINWNKSTAISKKTEHNLPRETLRSGRYYWRVRTYNEFGDVSDYSETGEFNIISKPPIPIIKEVVFKPQPFITWDSIEQKEFILTIKNEKEQVIYFKREYSDVKEHLANIYLEEGVYNISLYIVNSFGVSSDTSIYELNVVDSSLSAPNLEIYTFNFFNLIKTGKFYYCDVYRDNKKIGTTKDGMFKDYAFNSKKRHEYFLRYIDTTNGVFTDSKKTIVENKLRANTLALISSPGDFIKLEYTADPKDEQPSNFNLISVAQRFDGRKYPVIEFSEGINESRSLDFVVTKEILGKFRKLVLMKKQFIFRNRDGDNMIGNILEYSSKKYFTDFYNLSFTVIKTEVNEND